MIYSEALTIVELNILNIIVLTQKEKYRQALRRIENNLLTLYATLFMLVAYV